MGDVPKTQKNKSRKHFNPKHPSSIWTRQSKDNMLWLIEHAFEIERERLARNYKPHFSYKFLIWVNNNICDSVVPNGNLTEFIPAIPKNSQCRKIVEIFDNIDIVDQYRYYIALDKSFAVWSKNQPEWLEEYRKITTKEIFKNKN